jgi:predicted oxidoreductase
MMKTIGLGNSGLVSSRLVYGCMRISGDNSPADRDKGKQAIRAAIEAGYTHFDHADLYGNGASETLFSEVLKETPGLRKELLITGKCGIRGAGSPGAGDPKRYDFSRQYITGSVDGILQRLGIDSLDLLLLHRPDYLCDAQEVAGTFQLLQDSGQVRHFGVSNFRPSQVSMLQKFCPMPLLANQVEVNIDNLSALNDGTLDQCQELNISPMAWCPLGGVVYPAWGSTLSEAQTGRILSELERQAQKYQAEHWIIMLAWLLKHPAGILPIIGSTQPARIRAARKSLDLDYAATDWYRLLEARNGQEVP